MWRDRVLLTNVGIFQKEAASGTNQLPHNSKSLQGGCTIKRRAACRLDLPNEEQILAAIRVLPVLSCEDALEANILAAVFQSLLCSGERAKVQLLGLETDWKTDDVMSCMEALQRREYIKLDDGGFTREICLASAGQA